MDAEENICNVPFIGNMINENLNIPEVILDAYHRQVPQPTLRSQVSSHYSGRLHWYNSPYQVSLYGAFPLMTQWEHLEYKIEHCEEEYFTAYQRPVVFEYLKDFAKGFQHGFDNFLIERINNKHVLSSTEQSQTQGIMDFLSSPLNQFGFSEAHGGSRHPFSNWYNDGIIGGYHYRAWIIIFTNHKLFEDYFKPIAAKFEGSVKADTQEVSDITLGAIGFRSRYYDNFLALQLIISTNHAISLIGKDQESTFSYISGNYQNPFQPVPISVRLIDEVKKYLNDNLFSVDERRLLLKELLPHARKFGDDHIKRINDRIGLHKKLQKDLFMIDELEKTIKSLETIKGIISEEIANQFELLSSPSSAVIQKKVLPTTAFPDKIYQDVLITLSEYGKDLEKKPKVYSGQDEEGLRDHFLTNLTGRYERTSATGETFNSQGKTDILLKDDKGNNLFIAECKWWAGSKLLHATINQLFDRYTTWRDDKVAFIFFVNNRGFSRVLGQIEKEVAAHESFVEFKGKKDDSRFSFIFRQKIDIKRKVEVEFMFFHFVNGSEQL